MYPTAAKPLAVAPFKSKQQRNDKLLPGSGTTNNRPLNHHHPHGLTAAAAAAAAAAASVPSSTPAMQAQAEAEEPLTLPPEVEDDDVRVAMIGNVDSGKSTLIGVLTHAALDDGACTWLIKRVPTITRRGVLPIF